MRSTLTNERKKKENKKGLESCSTHTVSWEKMVRDGWKKKSC